MSGTYNILEVYGLPSPRSTEGWFKLSTQRGQDADAILERKHETNGIVYLAGFAVECALNGYLDKKGKRRPSKTSKYEAAHDLWRLWNATDFKMRDLHDPNGYKAKLLDTWGTHLRYELENFSWEESKKLCDAAKDLVRWLYVRAIR